MVLSCCVFGLVARNEDEATSDFDLLASFFARASPLVLVGLKGFSELHHVLQQVASKQKSEEFLLPAYRVFGRAIQVVGGSCFRFFSYLLSRFFSKRINKSVTPFISYLYLWTVGSGQQKVKASELSVLKFYNKCDKCMFRIDIFLSNLFTTMQDKFDELKLFSPDHVIEVAY